MTILRLFVTHLLDKREPVGQGVPLVDTENGTPLGFPLPNQLVLTRDDRKGPITTPSLNHSEVVRCGSESRERRVSAT